MEFRWRADGGPLLWYLDPLPTHQLKRHEIGLLKKRVWERERERERERQRDRERERQRQRERAYGARETFTLNFDFYVVWACMLLLCDVSNENTSIASRWREMLIRNWANEWQWLYTYHRTKNRTKGPFFSWMCLNNCWKTCWNRKFDKNAFQTKAFSWNMQCTDTDTFIKYVMGENCNYFHQADNL